MGEKDIAEKTLEAYNDVFCDIVNVLLFDGRELVKEEELTDAMPLSQYKADGGKLHEQERDVAKFWKEGRIRLCLYGLENQTDIDIDMPMRVISYDGAGYRAQLLADKDSKVCKVRYPIVTLVLYFGMERWNKHRSLLECFKVPEELKPYVNDYRVNVFEIAWLEPETVRKFKSDFRIVADYFVRMRINRDYEPSRETIRHVHEVLQLMSVLTKDRRFADIQIPLNVAEGGTTMCEVLDKVENRGIATGLARGREEGLATGRKEGLLTGVASTQALINRLLEENRLEDLRRASTDREYLQQLLEEEGLLRE